MIEDLKNLASVLGSTMEKLEQKIEQAKGQLTEEQKIEFDNQVLKSKNDISKAFKELGKIKTQL